MRLKARASWPISSAAVVSTVVPQSPAATLPALSASCRTGRVTRAVAHQLRPTPRMMPPAATTMPVQRRNASSCANSRLELAISRTPSSSLPFPVSGRARKVRGIRARAHRGADLPRSPSVPAR